jgi:hypothetical protein
LGGIPTNWESAIQTAEGCFSVSTSNGNQMFYSDGITIWDKNSNPMPNGTGLSGNNSSAQSGIIIPYPGQGGKFIIFSVNSQKTGGLAYSVVDMNLNGGLGDVVAGQKNIPLTGTGGSFGEALTAIRHANYRDYWVVATARNGSNIGTLNVWKVDTDGVHTAAISSIDTGAKYSGYWIGYMRFSKDGTKFWQGTAVSSPGGYVLANFNPVTGVFSNLKIKASSYGDSYSAEFSPNGRYVYATHIGGDIQSGVNYTSRLFVWDFDALMSASNISSVTPLKSLSFTGRQDLGTVRNDLNSNHFGAELMGPDGRMYISNAFTNSMYVIPDPDSDPANLKIYKLNHILDGGAGERNAWGLPVYTAIYFQLTMTQTSEAVCIKKPADFRVSITGGEGADLLSHYSINWGDGSPLDTNSNPALDTTFDHTHTYTAMGDYTVTINCYDTGNNIMPYPSYTYPVSVSNCRLPVNPNVRGRMW